MKAIGMFLIGLGMTETFIVYILFITEEYSRSKVSMLYMLPGIVVAVLGVICLTREKQLTSRCLL